MSLVWPMQSQWWMNMSLQNASEWLRSDLSPWGLTLPVKMDASRHLRKPMHRTANRE